MTIAHQFERIIIVPRNGYVNRLQAWASAAILAAEVDAPLEVLWEPEAVAPAGAEDLFDTARGTTRFLDADAVTSVLGQPHSDTPRYLTANPDRHLLVLAGHDRGEQAFMEELVQHLGAGWAPRTLLIIAGGKFHLPNAPTFARQRQLFYEQMRWHPSITETAQTLLSQRDPFVALHIRQTDRSLEAPPGRAISKALEQLRDRTGITSLFVAADTDSALGHWSDRASALGFSPWSSGTTQFDRGQIEAGRQAMVDWILLGHARGSVYSATSSFAEEAAVASGHVADGLALAAPRTLQSLRRGREVGRAGANRVARFMHRRP